MANTIKQHKKESAVKVAFRIVMILVGAACAAASIELFLVPNNIIDGGIIGISLILDYIFKDTPYINFATARPSFLTFRLCFQATSTSEKRS
jgi:uncharacterized membrane-anchored protein YitT (DUF2179 family)